MQQKLIVELPEQTKVRSVFYANKPLKLGGVVEEISVDELSKKINTPFIYSDSLFSQGEHPPYLKENSDIKKLPTNPLIESFEEIGFTDISAFVICNMGQLGHGVFANRDFEPERCLILYAGIIGERPSSNYAFSYSKEVTLSVDAEKVGNIARFIQHMPINFNLRTEYREKWLDYNQEKSENKPEFFEYWQWRNLNYYSGLTENDVAWANMSMGTIPLQGVPCAILYNNRKIHKGEQIGISYGQGYWLSRNIKPELFDSNGEVIPEKKYGYKEVVVSAPMIELLNPLPIVNNMKATKNYTAQMFQCDLQRKQDILQPVWFSHFTEPVSIFELRALLRRYNVIGKEYDAIHTEFVLSLKHILPKEYNIALFIRNPHQSGPSIYDVVITTDDLMKWSQLTVLLKSPNYSSLNLQIKCLKLTQEVILMDIENNLEYKYLYLKIFENAKNQSFFEKPLASELIPTGPTRKDKTGLLRPKSEESYNQIIRHNPGLTKKEIDLSYDMIEQGFNSSASSAIASSDLTNKNKEDHLNNATLTFFKERAPAQWKIYPSDKLTGNYVGHQVRFFTFPKDQAIQAKIFSERLQQNGFSAALKSAGEKPSIVVDLTTSNAHRSVK